MKAIRVHELRNRTAVRVDEIDEPEPGPGEVVVQLAAASINFPDILMLDGKYQIRPDLPFVAGKDGAGTVAAVGDGVTALRPGDRVMFYIHYGAFAEKVGMKASACHKLPETMPFDVAAAMGVTFQTAWAALVDRAGLRPGDRVLITGASGGVGMACVALAKALDAGVVVAGLSTLSKQDAVLAAGADHVLDLSGDDLKDTLKDRLRAIDGTAEVDIVIDVVGADTFDACLRLLRFNGRMVVLGFTGGRIPEVKTNYILLKNITIHGSSINAFYAQDAASVAHGQSEMFRLYQDGKLAPHIHARFSLDQVLDGIGVVENRSVVGKVVLHV